MCICNIIMKNGQWRAWAYWARVSDLERILRMKEAVSSGLKVDGTIRYSPGANVNTFMTSRAFMYCLVLATGQLDSKNVAGNFSANVWYWNQKNYFNIVFQLYIKGPMAWKFRFMRFSNINMRSPTLPIVLK